MNFLKERFFFLYFSQQFNSFRSKGVYFFVAIKSIAMLTIPAINSSLRAVVLWVLLETNPSNSNAALRHALAHIMYRSWLYLRSSCHSSGTARVALPHINSFHLPLVAAQRA